MGNAVTGPLTALAMIVAAPLFAQADAPFVGGHGATTPASYEGMHEGTRWHLDLWPDQAFHLQRTPLEGDAPIAQAGRWHADGRALVLDTGAEAVRLEVRNAERLRPAGAPEDASGDLVTEAVLDPAEISLPVSGMFTYLADAPGFLHCATGRFHPVLQEDRYLPLEQAYLRDRPGPGEPLFVTFEATIGMRPQMEGPDRLSVIVNGPAAIWPGEDCARAAERPALADTVWRITALGGAPLDWAPPAREPFLLLDAGTGRFNASVGCNTMLGGVTITGDDLSFGLPASTMMACPDPLAAQEAQLAATIETVASFAIGGRTLRLFDADGATLAELEAVYLP